jgi:hypothetical protein
MIRASADPPRQARVEGPPLPTRADLRPRTRRARLASKVPRCRHRPTWTGPPP